ncbi:gamma-type small acid-soluble spore protein [Terrilactibacillus sp. BCM23-1]|uniref:Small, acid-soluble spore protein gamma-type n=1 Tax=Terrilactibacillus tamarindi TaxID=2599694 RepID=A0A6N8CSU1_9BACI|nr:gamma-type small acid-soluble spore protein [Terrilactibacillus tamarindi]MTT33249.1 gamma-type small acid-soluble spore protein [Terrilactibacillus tamarindi]
MGKKTQSSTNAQQVRKQNQQSAAGTSAGQFEAEFGSETDVQQVRKQNQQSLQKKGQNQK